MAEKSDQTQSTFEQTTGLEKNNAFDQYSRLSRLISYGDLQGVRTFLDQQPDAITVGLDDGTKKETPLIIACHCGQLEIVKELSKRLSLEEMMIPTDEDSSDISPLGIAASNGNYEIVEVLFEKISVLDKLTYSGRYVYDRNTPDIIMASQAGHEKITRYLYDRTKSHLLHVDKGYWAGRLLHDAIFYGMFDFVLDIFEKDPTLAVTAVHSPYVRSSKLAVTPLESLALKPEFLVSHFGFWRRLVYSCIITDQKLPAHVETTIFNRFKRLLWMLLQCLPEIFGIKSLLDLKKRYDRAYDFVRGLGKGDTSQAITRALFQAVKHGNKELFVELIKCKPDLLHISYREPRRNLFGLAVAYRQNEIFNLIHGLDDRKFSLLTFYDQDKNNILHITALPPLGKELSKVAGAALMIQRELQWFMEVKSVVAYRERKNKNKEDMTPRQLFKNSHEPLRKEGEKWMKYTANACSLVAVLIATVTFQAIYTIPGGNDQNSGDPIHLKDTRFMVFIISNTLAFFASCTSVLIFLTMLTSRYSFDDFSVSLPRKMILGLTILFASIAAMLVAFSSALYVTLRQKPLLAIPVMPLACLPAILFAMLQFPLLKEMISSTLGNGLFDRNTKRWF